MSNSKIKRILTYPEYEIMLNKLCKQILDQGIKFDVIKGIPRGGLPIAVHLSHYLDIPFNSLVPNPTILLVDDIADSGKTIFNQLCSFWDPEKAIIGVQIWTATLFYTKKVNIFPPLLKKPHFSLCEKDENTWIVFPWERKDEKMEKDNDL